MKKLLKFLTCGSVDDGKSTLIGHLLYDAKLIFTDQEKTLELDSKVGSREGKIDYSLLLDGLSAEREQGITIDVAYKYFSTEKRSFIVADTPGHEQYTRNMAVGASFADLAIVLVDVTKGILTQTRRHTRIVSMMGIKHIILAVNKMDLISYDKSRFYEIEREYRKFVSDFDFDSITIIPISATEGDNITSKSTKTYWYKGLSLMKCLESIDINVDKEDKFFMPVQRVCRPNSDFRGYQGQIASGEISTKDEVVIIPGFERSCVKRIYVGDKTQKLAKAGQPVTIVLEDEIDISRGSVICKENKIDITDKFTATILWMDDSELYEGRNYILKLGTKKVLASVMKIKYKIDINTGNYLKVSNIFKNEMAVCDFELSEFVPYDVENLKNFILIDKISNMTSSCGVISHSLRRSNNIKWQELDVTRQIRANKMGQKPVTLWFTGLSGSGKSTLANVLEKKLVSMGKYTMLLDGDNIRHGINKDLGFMENDRIENIRRISEISKLMNDGGLIVITAFISPFSIDRNMAKNIIGKNNFYEIYVSTPLDVCESRDVKGLYKKARNGEIPNFTGISSRYDVPNNPDIIIDTDRIKIDEAVALIIEKIFKE